MRVGTNESYIRAKNRAIDIHIPIIHITHFARINGFPYYTRFRVTELHCKLNFEQDFVNGLDHAEKYNVDHTMFAAKAVFPVLSSSSRSTYLL